MRLDEMKENELTLDDREEEKLWDETAWEETEWTDYDRGEETR